MRLSIYNIEWDLYDEDEDRNITPEEAGVEDEIIIEASDITPTTPKEILERYAEEYLDAYPWHVKSYKLKVW